MLTKADIQAVLATVPDPEIPHVSIVDLGMISGIDLNGDEWTVKMLPTFTGCPAIDVIQKDIEKALEAASIDANVQVDRETAWNSNRITEEGRAKLEKFGLAPPPIIEGELSLEDLDKIRCPHCGSTDTTLRSMFGSTLCRAIRYCYSCQQGFEQFKPLE